MPQRSNMVDRAFEWGIAAIVVVVILYVIATMVVQFVQTLPWYGQLLIGGGVLTAILYGARQVFYEGFGDRRSR